MPFASVVTAPDGTIVPPPFTANVTETPGTGVLSAARTMTEGGWVTGFPADPPCEGGLTASILNATGPADTWSVTGITRDATPGVPDETVTVPLYDPSLNVPTVGWIRRVAVGSAVVPPTNEVVSHGTDAVADRPVSVPAPALLMTIDCGVTAAPR
jgi:hypothetical protein